MYRPPMQNVSLPMTTSINGMFPDRIITVKGRIRPNCSRFSINLLTGPGENADFALHFNPRFDEGNVIVRNSRINGAWQNEEREITRFPFGRGQNFEVAIRCTEEGYKISVNGEDFIFFKHRVYFYNVSHLKIMGEINVNNVSFSMEKSSSSCTTVQYPAPDSQINIPFNNLKNRSVRIIGKFVAHADRFSVNFCNQQNVNVFHTDIRSGEQSVVRNSNLNGWGAEERGLPDRFPFAVNSPFQIEIAVDQQGFHFKLNGVHQFVYNHRFRPINQIRTVYITPGATIHEVSFY